MDETGDAERQQHKEANDDHEYQEARRYAVHATSPVQQCELKAARAQQTTLDIDQSR